jgi:short-subunit dehydrogenase
MFEGVKQNNFSFLMPILDTKEVAKKSIRAIKRGDGQIIMPYFPTLIYLMRFLFPATIFDRVMYDLVGVGSTMNQFGKTSRTDKDFELKSKL